MVFHRSERIKRAALIPNENGIRAAKTTTGIFMKKSLLAFGEILFDVYPTGAKIGGAPLNFAAHFAALGNESAMCSALGEDDYGRNARAFLKRSDVCDTYVATLSDCPTGYCGVTYENGEPKYDLVRGVAYDKIPFPEGVCGKRWDLFYFGTLALRGEKSKETAKRLLAEAKAKTRFCDLNLRGSFYTWETVLFCFENADVVKLNREEYAYCRKMLSEEGDMPSFARALCRRFSLCAVLITLDKDGCFFYDAASDRAVEKGISPCRFVSAVGAGDSFSACFLHHYLDGAPFETALEKAARLSAYVVSFEEAIPAYDAEIRAAIG